MVDCLSRLFKDSPDSQNTGGNNAPETALGPYTEPECLILFSIPESFKVIAEH